MTQTANDVNRRSLNRTGAAVAIMVVMILGVSIVAFVHFDIPAANHDILLVLVTAVATNVTAIVAYFFGSSVGTSRQGEIISTMANTAAATQAATAPATVTTTTVQTPQAPPRVEKTVPLAAGETVAVKADEAPQP